MKKSNQIIIHYQENEIMIISDPIVVPQVGEIIQLSVTVLDKDYWNVEPIDGDFKVISVKQHYNITYKGERKSKGLSETDEWMNIYVDVEKLY